MWCISFVVWEHDQKRNINIVLRNELYYNYIGERERERERESERERERDLLLLLDGTIGLYTCKWSKWNNTKHIRITKTKFWRASVFISLLELQMPLLVSISLMGNISKVCQNAPLANYWHYKFKHCKI